MKNKLENQFVTYEIALVLKELWFNEKCFGYYNDKMRFNIQQHPEAFYSRNDSVSSWCTSIFASKQSKKNACQAPLYQQVIDWFREEHNIHITFLLGHDEINIWYDYHIMKIENTFDYTPLFSSENGKSYEGAREQAILKAIELIKIK